MTQFPAMRNDGEGVLWRVIQFSTVLKHRHNPEADHALRGVLQNDAQWMLLQRLSAFDRAHHLRVHQTLRAAGHDDPDLLLAAALHDVGKTDERGRVRLAHRVLKVLLRSTSPRLLERAARKGGGWLRHGLFLAQHHHQLGAELVRGTGASQRCAELIARHEDQLPVDDDALALLIRADAGAIA